MDHHLTGRLEDGGPSQRIMCKYCPKYLNDVFQFYSHANSDHLDLIAHEWVSCGICKVFLPTTEALKHHKSVNHCGKNSLADRVQCRYCHNSYLTAFQLYKHANKTHLDFISREWQCCTTCNFFLPTSEALTNHKAHAHSTRSGTSERVQCNFCPDTFCSIQQYYKHANKGHLEVIATKWHPCQICSFYLPSMMALTNHKGRAHSTQRNTSKRVQCSFCPDTICSLQQYYKHANKEHFDVVMKEWYCCDTCNFFLPSAEALTNHKGRAHSVRNPNSSAERVQCSFCSDSLCSLQQYYKHANKDHWEIIANGWQLCQTCNFYLPTAVALTNHKGRAHVPQKTMPKKTRCNFCSEAFYGPDDYHRHANHAHLDIISEKWQIHCKSCYIYFPTSMSLKRHKEMVHSLNKPEGASHRFHNEGTGEEERMTVLPDIKQEYMMLAGGGGGVHRGVVENDNDGGRL